MSDADKFRHIVRIADADLDGNKKIIYALTGIKGIGIRMARAITNQLDIDIDQKMGELDDESVEKLIKFIEQDIEQQPSWMLNRRKDMYTGQDLHILSKDVDFATMVDVERLIRMKGYRGDRHAKGKKARGQRTRSMGRRGRTVGVVRRRR